MPNFPAKGLSCGFLPAPQNQKQFAGLSPFFFRSHVERMILQHFIALLHHAEEGLGRKERPDHLAQVVMGL